MGGTTNSIGSPLPAAGKDEMGTPMRIAVQDVSGTSWQAFCFWIVVGALAALPAAAQAQTADDGVEVRAYGAVGLADGETARVTVLNLLSPLLHPPNPCRVHLAFVDAAAAIWPGSNRQPASRTADLLPGESVTLTLAFDDIRGAVTGVRASVRAVMVNTAAPNVPPNPCDGLAPMLEIFDARSGWIQAAYSDPGPLREAGAEDGLAGTLQVRLGHLGLARGLVARLNASRVGLPSRSPEVPPSPCLITLEFRNRDGELFTTRSGGPAQIQAELGAGQTISLELSSADAVRGNRVAEVMHPLLTTRSPAHPPSPCDDVIGTVEILDGLNGRLQGVWAAPGPPSIPALDTR
jgi:hypothetical protein